METRYWKVGEVAELAHVTVRTLHHYDEIGLLVPSQRSGTGYRLYSQADLERLYQILLYRELGFPLESIAQVLDAPALDRRSALRAQRELLVEKRRKTDAVIRAVDRVLESIERGTKMSSEEMKDGFDAFADAPEDIRAHQAKYGSEARERWGDTDAYKESMRRARRYTKADWKAIQEAQEANMERMAELMAAGAAPDGAEAMAGAEAMRQHIDRWFYPCSPEMHAGLADMYEADPRFKATYEQRATGLAAFVAAAIRANARRASAEGAE
ncbi:MAG TPA: MerR family transcriptional regulator [Longimicrobiales bacterium]